MEINSNLPISPPPEGRGPSRASQLWQAVKDRFFRREPDVGLDLTFKAVYKEPVDRRAINANIQKVAKLTDEELDSILTFSQGIDLDAVEKPTHVTKENDNILLRSVIVNPSGGVCPPGVYVLAKSRGTLNLGGSSNRATNAVHVETGKTYAFRSGYYNTKHSNNELEALNQINQINKNASSPTYLVGGDIVHYKKIPNPDKEGYKRFEKHIQEAEKIPNPEIEEDEQDDYYDEEAEYRKVGVLCPIYDRSDLYSALRYVPKTNPSLQINNPSLHPFTENEGYRFINQAATGLKRMHQNNLVHRDIKSENILVHGDALAGITDFGFTCQKDSYNYKLGTPGCRPIIDALFEIPDGDESKNAKFGRAHDLFALGLVMIETHHLDQTLPILNQKYEEKKVTKNHSLFAIMKYAANLENAIKGGELNEQKAKAFKDQYLPLLEPHIQKYKTKFNAYLNLLPDTDLNSIIKHLLSLDPNTRVGPFTARDGKVWDDPLDYVIYITQKLSSA